MVLSPISMTRGVSIILLFVASSISAKSCEWLGHAPVCGTYSCPRGWMELVKSGDMSSSFLAEFGDICTVGVKTLCCKMDTDGHTVKQGQRCTRQKNGCPNGQEKIGIERIAYFFLENEYYNICCDREIL
ncbi:hypothetical protein PRIPAC_88383 [Pristionchus pacificus]|uniref:Uncharacterized protein n=1 Tax=Pristionchus pacificus TaxID=54126 RepID=A0A2A6CTJ8_PRIPA|nr:hypothetical protein PRIPAC_88383 [Pristionchus pacificus]|eukprot:PDM81430.1 hypothetical protein PRIPAC_35306 [Pristionchus pacificus]